ncbi:hypothetical protein BpHYR1_001658 [Brachionus plicatilis]|uniref:Uncharacterized protein n=1 Tax=Brachionus plicatilis TaxID=10195 RepID=A0A3M7SXJ5_BRAPC|nr:hypothetical protein BpHYR1_001658 [Brachionus plicatilis]
MKLILKKLLFSQTSLLIKRDVNSITFEICHTLVAVQQQKRLYIFTSGDALNMAHLLFNKVGRTLTP